MLVFQMRYVDKLLGIRWYVKGCMRSRGYY